MNNLTQEQIADEIINRMYNACLGLTYGSKILDKTIKITVRQCFIDGLLAVPPKDDEPLILPGSIHNVDVKMTFK